MGKLFGLERRFTIQLVFTTVNYKKDFRSCTLLLLLLFRSSARICGRLFGLLIFLHADDVSVQK
jgi:hypothetical protein